MVDADSKRKSVNKTKIDDITRELLLEAYRQAWDYDKHLTSTNWLIASIFVAGIFGALGLVLSQGPTKQPISHSVTFIAAIGIFIIFAWFLFVRRNRALSFAAREPALEIERMLTAVLGRLGPLEMAANTSSRPKGHEIVQFFVIGLVWFLLVVTAQDWVGLGVFTVVAWVFLILIGISLTLAIRIWSPDS